MISILLSLLFYTFKLKVHIEMILVQKLLRDPGRSSLILYSIAASVIIIFTFLKGGNFISQ